MENKANKFLLPLITLLSVLGACTDVIEIDAPLTEARLVVDGWIYDDRDIQTVVLTNSTAYFEDSPQPPETNATVTVTNASGISFPYTEVEPGTYEADFRGEVGDTYTMTIETTDGARYVSDPQFLLPVPSLDAVYALLVESPEVEEEDEGLYPAWDFVDPQGIDNFYRWKFYVNGIFLNEPNNLLVFSDEFVDGEELDSAYSTSGVDPLVSGDSLVIEQLSLTEEARDFFVRVRQITVDVGGLFDTPPDPVRGNFINVMDDENYALGFFGASSIVRSSTKVE